MGWPSTYGLASWFASPLVSVAVGFLGGRSELQASPRALRSQNVTEGVLRACAKRGHDGLGVPVGMRRAWVKTRVRDVVLILAHTCAPPSHHITYINTLYLSIYQSIFLYLCICIICPCYTFGQMPDMGRGIPLKVAHPHHRCLMPSFVPSSTPCCNSYASLQQHMVYTIHERERERERERAQKDKRASNIIFSSVSQIEKH